MVGVVNMPEETIKKLYNRILPQWKVCFISALIVGLIAHLYKITSWLPNWDSLVFRYDAQNMIHLGRWFLPVACSVSSFYDLPFLNGLLAIIYHAVGAVFICNIFKINKKTSAFMIGAIVASFPTVTSVFMYNYVADGYGMAFMFSCMAAYCMVKENPKWVLSSCLIALSVGIYQAYITVTVSLLMAYLLSEIVLFNKSTKEILLKAGKFFVFGLIGMLLYALVLKVILFITGQSLIEYQGLSSVANASGFDLYASLYSAKEIFFGYFFDFSKGVTPFITLNLIVFLLMACICVDQIYKNKIYKSIGKLILFAVIGLFFILGTKVLVFLNPEVDYHNLMLMAYVIIYIFPVIIYEKLYTSNDKATCQKTCNMIFIVALCIIFNQIVTSNVSYHKAQIAYEKSYGKLMRIADRIEQTEGAEKCDEILVIGALDNSEAYSSYVSPEITGITDGYILRADDEIVGQSVLCSALNDYCDKNYTFLSGDKKKMFLEKDRVKDMNKWPLQGSIAVIDDVIVINLGAESE